MIDKKAAIEAYKITERNAHDMIGDPAGYLALTGSCPVAVVERQAQRLGALLKQLDEAEAALAALKGEQVPVAWHHATLALAKSDEDKKSLPQQIAARYSIPLFTAPQKPVAIDSDIVLDANRYRFLRDEDAWGEDSDSWHADTKTGLISSENLIGLSLGNFDDAIDARMAASDIPFLNPVTAPQKPVVLPSEVKELIAHIDDVLDNHSFERIDPKKWNAVTFLIAIGDIEAAGGTDKVGK